MALSGAVPFCFWGGGKRKVRVKVGEQFAGDLAAGDGERPRAGQRGRVGGEGGGGAQNAGAAFDFESGPVSGPTASQADADESAPVCGDAGGAPGDQRDQGPHCGDGLAGAGAARREGGRIGLRERKLRALRRTLEEPNASDSFRTLIEQVIEDALTGGYGAIEMEPTGDGERPAMLWAVDGASIRINPRWDGQPESPRYAQTLPGQLESSAIDLRDDQLMYVRMNPRSFTPFGLGPLEVAFETVNQFLSAHRFAGKLAANTVAQYALWLNEATPTQHDRLIRWWQDEIEGTGRVPLISTSRSRRCCGLLRDGCGYAAGLAGVSDPHGGQRIRIAAADAGPGGGCQQVHSHGDDR